MKVNLCFMLFMLMLNFGIAQNHHIINKESTSFKIKGDKDSINFIVVDNDINCKKPIFLWCQGSLPVPLYINFKKDGLWMIGGGISNFDYQEIKRYYHLVVITMPKTPLVVDETKVNKSYFYYGNSNNQNVPSIEFQKEDFLENYVDRAITVLKFLSKQKWVNNSKLVVAGHSQGSKVAIGIASKYKKVTKLGLFSANPFGRIDQNIRKHRKDAELGVISWETADKKIENEYQYFRDANDTSIRDTNANLISWYSFSRPQVKELLDFNKPIYLAYATGDIASDLCDLVPLYFIQAHKKNLTYNRYLNMEHNFFEINNAKVDHNKPHWKEVMSSFVKWTIE
ncbi:hypothetical protein [Sphingobacterium sp.]|uniref:hypothetical protein n=1 Tax=Sphingobacterium sp. TaxID=341027 RepID=UPI002FDE3137